MNFLHLLGMVSKKWGLGTFLDHIERELEGTRKLPCTSWLRVNKPKDIMYSGSHVLPALAAISYL